MSAAALAKVDACEGEVSPIFPGTGRWQPERLTEGPAMENLRRRYKGGNNARLFRGLRT
ncbi:hypothetical protein [Sphingorhabdus sp.]|jgi:hypothetical protein|uniref:hypothetical protein n=1 Tax=Sphingorhabdus sp. TaxID=1902408 RepID=UPI0037CC8041